MKAEDLLISDDWLRRKIVAARDLDTEAGLPLPLADENVAVISEQKAVRLRFALGTLVRQLRMRDGLTIAQLAERASVVEEELREVEHNPNYTARPRLLFQLSEFFGVSLANLNQIAGVTHAVERTLFNAATKYAARSEDLAKLTQEERDALDQFVAVLNERRPTQP
jgi:transcriptional regulator with XRE-family HTH domain